jgi:hypothetical protein
MRKMTAWGKTVAGWIAGMVFLLAGFNLASPPLMAAPSSELWERWTVSDSQSPATIGHAEWDRFLSRYVVAGEDGVNRVAYGIVTRADRDRLVSYIQRLAALPIGAYRRDEQFAFWVNLYNALTVKLVLDRYPVESIRDIDISPGLFSDGPWGKKIINVEGQELSLDDIEHRILRPIWRDARIHYAVNCAALSCPNLMRHAFTAGNTECLLEAAARAYVNNPRGVAFENEGRVVASRIYDWYAADFGGTEEAVLAHLRAYAAPPLAARLAGIQEIDDYRYDWLLNEAAATR